MMKFSTTDAALAVTLWLTVSPMCNAATGFREIANVQQPVTLTTLLNEMIDRNALARWPAPTYTCQQFSSYDRASVARDKPGWFANQDNGNYLRSEDRNGRQEYVMMDAEGPGAIVGFFKASTDPTAIVRIYLDGLTTPVIEENLRYLLGGGTETEQEKHFPEPRVLAEPPDETRFLGGFGTIKPPLAGVQSLGCTLYLPIPYARHGKVTYDKPGKCYYRINYRTYAPTTPVETFTLASLKTAAPTIERVSQTLLKPKPVAESRVRRLPGKTQVLETGATLSDKVSGPAALRLLTVRLKARDMAQALRSTVLRITFDGTQTVWCPVGDFFSTGIGVHTFQSWDKTVEADGTMRCYWVMPFKKSCTVALVNLSAQSVTATLGDLEASRWAWDNRSLYFHANWRQQYPIQTKAGDGTVDWNYIEATGQGVYVGDSLIIHNGSDRWWGEGDEKIYVDGEAFPSHFGTGTEDYYGYSRGGRDSAFFEAPFIIHSQIEGDKQPGYSAMTRVRSLDAVPFSKRLKFDMEIWHWAATDMAYAATSYWYALPGATCNRLPDNAAAGRAILPDVTLSP